MLKDESFSSLLQPRECFSEGESEVPPSGSVLELSRPLLAPSSFPVQRAHDRTDHARGSVRVAAERNGLLYRPRGLRVIAADDEEHARRHVHARAMQRLHAAVPQLALVT